MSVFFELSNEEKVEILMPRKQAYRLKKTCFRGRGCRRAGNLFAWDCFRDFQEDDEARKLLFDKIEDLIITGQVRKKNRLEIEFSRDVGWDSTISYHKLSASDIAASREKRLNSHTKAMILPMKRGGIMAPRTNIVTIVLSMRRKAHWLFTIQTIYPGNDCGGLGGHMTIDKGLYFFDFNHPGT